MQTETTQNKPLIIFGYGSLLWKQEFPYEKRVNGYLKNYVRRFYQGSTDHRGTEENPGRVVTLLPHAEESVFGSAFIIAEEKRTEVLSYLDYREKDGYSTIYVDIYEKLDDTQPVLTSVMTYIATEKNIRYLGEPQGGILEIARHIAHSEGPSGKNSEYLFRLATAVQNFSIYDPHLMELERLVKKFLLDLHH